MSMVRLANWWLRSRPLLLCSLSTVAQGCGNAEPSSVAYTDWILFRETAGNHERYLIVAPDGAYESAVLNEHRARKGKLTDAQIEQLQGLVSEHQFDTYLDEALAGCQSSGIDDAIETVRWSENIAGSVHARGGCWSRANVASEETRAFLDTISDMQMTLAAQ